MNVQCIHFTEGATDPVEGFRAHGVRIVTVADGGGADETYVSCLHFEPGGWITDPPVVRDSGLLVVHGAITFFGIDGGPRLDICAGVGLVLAADEPYRLQSDSGAIVLCVESERLESTSGGRSTPERIWGQVWPGESVVRRPRLALSMLRSIYFRVRWWRVRLRWWRPFRRRLARGQADSSGWAPTRGGESLLDKVLAGRGKDGPSR